MFSKKNIIIMVLAIVIIMLSMIILLKNEVKKSEHINETIMLEQYKVNIRRVVTDFEKETVEVGIDIYNYYTNPGNRLEIYINDELQGVPTYVYQEADNITYYYQIPYKGGDISFKVVEVFQDTKLAEATAYIIKADITTGTLKTPELIKQVMTQEQIKGYKAELESIDKNLKDFQYKLEYNLGQIEKLTKDLNEKEAYKTDLKAAETVKGIIASYKSKNNELQGQINTVTARKKVIEDALSNIKE